MWLFLLLVHIPPPAAAPLPVITAARAADLLYPGKTRGAPASRKAKAALGACPGSRRVAIRCLLRRRYAADRRARTLALRIFDATGTVLGLEPARRMDGGWRGRLKLVPHLPIRRQRRHVVRLELAFTEYAKLFKALQRRARRAGTTIRYRWRPLHLRFFRSVGRRTPSAYASGWTVAWNVNGSLLRTTRGVRETMWHEVFHLNDHAHKDWSVRALTRLHAAIVKRCTRGKGRRKRLSNRCLKPYAPHKTKVMGRTYYAFHPESGVGEYAAELAVRYFLEHRAVLSGRPPRRPFKCGPPENRRSWTLLTKEFFGGVDLVPACR